MPHTFKKEERLCSFREINALLKEGKRFNCDSFKVIYKYCMEENGTGNEPGIRKILISVPKKLFKRAVDRNLLKRRIREAYRKNKDILDRTGQLSFMVIYNSREVESYGAVESQIKKILQKMAK